MARFSAFTSDTSDSEDDDHSSSHESSDAEQNRHSSYEPEHADEEEEGDEEDTDDSEEDSSSSDMHEDELLASPSRTKRPVNAFEDDRESGNYHEAARGGDGGRGAIANNHQASSSTRTRADPSIIPWAQQIGIDAQRLHVMQTSFFRMPEEAAALKAMNQPTRSHLQMAAQSLHRKHSRDSDGDGLRFDSRERTSFDHAVEPRTYRPSRKYSRVDISASAVNGSEGAMADAGLSLGRSFRVGWGPRGVLVHLGELCGPSSTSRTSANSSIIMKTSMPISSSSEFGEMASTLLQHHLSHSPIEPDEDGIPFANPSADLRFSSFVSLFSATDRSYKASLFRLGHALFDDIDLRLGDTISVDVRNRVSALSRRAALSAWLEEAVANAVESDLKEAEASSGPIEAAYTLLTGNQVEKAIEKAISGKSMKLATLISQGPGDFEFKEDLREQLRIWKEQRIDAHINTSIRKVYALLAGVVDVVDGSKGTGLERCPDIDLLKGLDWKRTFGLHLWFSEPLDSTIAQVFQSYNQLWKESPTRVTPPLPWHIENSPSSSQSSSWQHPHSTSPLDGLFSLIKLHAEPACSLSHILTPLSFGPSPVDYSLPWHLYVLLSRCIRVRDFSDRDDPGVDVDMDGHADDGTRVEGHSPSADLLASSYAFQLEELGMIQEALFVLLHIEGSVGREKAIKDMLFRSAPSLDEWMTRGVVGSLKIPKSWVNEAKAIHALDKGDVWDAYELYISAGLYNAAHELAVLKLAPEIVIHQDLELLKQIFSKIANHGADGWHDRGKVFLDYIHIMKRLPGLHEEIQEQELGPDATQATELDELTRRIPKLITVLPDALWDRSDSRHNVALAKMISGLMIHLDKVQPLALSPAQVQSTLVDQATKIHHIHSTARERFLRAIEVV